MSRQRVFIDALSRERCKAIVTLRDGTTADCGRRATMDGHCWQHSRATEAETGMGDQGYLKGVAHVCTALLKNAKHSFGIQFDTLNETLIETEKRAAALGMKRKDLYPGDEK